MNRGSAIGPARVRGSSPCFNEAPIHESGKSDIDGKSRPIRCGFNEAPIHESGKSGTG